MFTNLGSLQLSDWWRGLIVAVVTVPLTVIYDSAMTGALVFDWKKIIAAALVGGIAYLLKNLGTGSSGNLLTNK